MAALASIKQKAPTPTKLRLRRTSTGDAGAKENPASNPKPITAFPNRGLTGFKVDCKQKPHNQS